MKTVFDANQRLLGELELWQHKQVNNIFDDYYFYYLPSTSERDGGLLISKTKPQNRQLFNDTKDLLHRDGVLTDLQANNWIYPNNIYFN